MNWDCTYIDYQSTNSFSELVYDYIQGKEQLKPFFAFSPDRQGIEQSITMRRDFPVNRIALVNALQNQYQSLHKIEVVDNNILSLAEENTYTICTAHQPNLLTGYLYFFYKILHAIKMAEDLNSQHPELHFVPVYYMGSEDNDLDELGQFWYEHKRYKWTAEGQKGAVGRMKTKSLKALFEDLFRKFGPPGQYCEELITLITDSYLQKDTIGEASQYLVHQLFGHYGLIVLNPDDKQFKTLFSSIIRDELLHQNAFEMVSKQSELLAKDYKAQAFPRPINLFYLNENIRERIEKEGNIWNVLNTNIQFTEAELLSEIDKHPENFSPNVILRGLFQETILPNICFIGGGAELAYWLQLKPIFEFYKVFYPVLFLRQSVQIITIETQKLIAQSKLDIKHIFDNTEEIIKQQIIENKGISWDLHLESVSIAQSLKTIQEKAILIDKTLERSAEASLSKIKKQIAILEQKMYRAEKRKEKERILKITRIKGMVYPEGGLQERVENFMPYFLQNGFSIFDTIKKSIKPFDNLFIILSPKK